MNPIHELKSKLDSASLWQGTIALNRGDFLNMAGSVDTNLYYVIEGGLRIFFVDKNQDQTIRLGYSGNMIAALDSFMTGAPSKLSIQALKKCTLLSIGKSRLMDFVESDPSHLRMWTRIMEAFVVQQMEREHDILIHSPQERYQRVLARSPQVFQEIPSKYIASYLRMTPETLSRLKKS